MFPLILFSILSLVSLGVVFRLRLFAAPLPVNRRGNTGYLAMAFLLGLGASIVATPIAATVLIEVRKTITVVRGPTSTTTQTTITESLTERTSGSATAPTTAAVLPPTMQAATHAGESESNNWLAEHPREWVSAMIVGFGVGAMIMLALRPLAYAGTPQGSPISLLRQASLGIVTFVLVWPPVMLVGDLSKRLLEALGSDIPTTHDLIALLQDPNSPRGIVALVVISAAVSAPLFEETLFRGSLQPLLTNLFSYTKRRATGGISGEARVPRFAAIVVTSLLFSGLHPAFSIPAIFVLSLALGLLYERTGRLLPCIIAHVAFNATQLAFALLQGPP